MSALDFTSTRPFNASIGDTVPKPVKKDDARTRILKTALSEFASRGYDGVSTTEIAKAAGVTQPLIHYHFKSKEALWKATVEQIFCWLREEFVNSVEFNTDEHPEQKFKKFVRMFVEFSGRHPEFGQLMLREGTQLTERLEWLVTEWIQPMLKDLMQGQQKGVEEGWLKDIPFAQVASILTAVGTHFFSLAPFIESVYGVNPQDPEQLNAYTNTVVEMACQLVFTNQAIKTMATELA